MSTYASNSEIKFDTGRAITTLLDEELSANEQQNVIRVARERAYNRINAKLRGKTAIPAFHVPSLKQVEIDYVISDLVTGAYTLEVVNQSEWAEKYMERADEVLATLVFEASAERPVADRSNVGDGTLKIIDVFSEYAKTEVWTFTATSSTEFSVYGSVSGAFPALTVDTEYPEREWATGIGNDYGLQLQAYPAPGRTPFSCKINEGNTPFEKYDVFTVKIFASEESRQNISSGKLVRA